MADRRQKDVLFGLVATRLALVSDSDLSQAFLLWAEDARAELPRLLADRGGLPDGAAELIWPLVDRLLRENENDFAGSVASLAGGGSSVEFLLAGVEAPEAATARLAAGATRRPGDEATADSGGSGRRSRVGAAGRAADPDDPLGPRFSILRTHDAGGLGVVFVARDHELNRLVALKEMNDQGAVDPGRRERFVLEAEVTGLLEHPGVVPIYGLGTSEDGRPFYAMKFVRGENLGAAVRAFHDARPDPSPGDFSGVEFRGLLGRLIDVCNAVQYAHGRGVLHRDLKPGNIMLGKHGETLVVDWGLAKVVGSADRREGRGDDEATVVPLSGGSGSHTREGDAVGTPMYMSPEAARGDLDAMGPATDVYSLGATLYVLLTGRPAFESGADILDRVRAGEFLPPRDVRGGVPPALEAVCLKAMAGRPDARHASAEAMAADLERWLADEPVSAYPEPAAERVRRLARRNPTATLTALAASLLAAAGVAAFGAVVAGKNADLAAANNALTESREAEREQRLLAEANAEAAGDLAAEIIEFADTRLSQIGGQDGPRQELAERAYRRFREVVDRGDPSPEDVARLAQAARMAGNMKRVDDKLDEAEELLDESIALWRSLPADAAEPRLLAETLRDRAMLHKLRDETPEALPLLAEANDLLTPLLAADPDDAGLARTQASIGMERTGPLKDRGRYEEMLSIAEEAETLYTRLAGTPERIETDYTYSLMAASDRIEALRRLGRHEKADAAFAAAAERGRRYAEAAPARHVRHFFARLLLFEGERQIRRDPVPGGIAELAAEATERQRLLTEEFGGYHADYLARGRLLRALVNLSRGETDGVAEDLDAAVEHFEQKTAGEPAAYDFYHLARCYEGLAKLTATIDGDPSDQRSDAQQAASKALALNPDFIDAAELFESLREPLRGG